MKHIKPADHYAVAGKTITIESTRASVEPVITPAANVAAHPGKLNYLGKTKPPKAKPVPPETVRRVERAVTTQGKYFGSSEQVCAFVMLDEEAAPKGDAANDPKM